MIDKGNFLNLNILKKEEYTGSMDGMRYRLVKKEEGDEKKIMVAVWPEPFCFLKTPEENKIYQEFSFDEEGKNHAADWLNRQWIEMEKKKS